MFMLIRCHSLACVLWCIHPDLVLILPFVESRLLLLIMFLMYHFQ